MLLQWYSSSLGYTFINPHHHHPSAAKQATTRFLHAQRSSARAAICSSCFVPSLFIIPKQSLYTAKVWSMWSTRSPFANGWDVQSISSSRLFLWHSENVTKKFQLVVPNQVNQRASILHSVIFGQWLREVCVSLTQQVFTPFRTI